MSDITFQKPIYFNESFEDKNLIEDYKIKFDYIITIFLAQENKIINGIFTKDEPIKLDINEENIKKILNDKITILKNGNFECITEGISPNKDVFINRIFEILSLKLFGDARYKTVFNNDEDKTCSNICESLSKKIIEIINIYKNELKTFVLEKDVLDMNNLEIIENEFNISINKTNILLPFTFSGEILELEDGLKALFESTSYGGAQIIDGKYNIPLLIEIKRII